MMNFTNSSSPSAITSLDVEDSLKYSVPPTHHHHPQGSSVIALSVATIPIIILIVILASLKICDIVCPQGQRREFMQPSRRISSFSSFASAISRNNSSTQLSSISRNGSAAQLASSSSAGHNAGHLSLNFVHAQHHPQHTTIRADGTPLLAIELETIREPEGLEEFEDEPLSFQVKVQ